MSNVTAKAEFAHMLVNNPAWKEMFYEAKKHYFEAFCEDDDMKSRERIAMAMDVLNDLDSILADWVMNGVDVSKTLKQVGDNDGRK